MKLIRKNKYPRNVFFFNSGKQIPVKISVPILNVSFYHFRPIIHDSEF